MTPSATRSTTLYTVLRRHGRRGPDRKVQRGLCQGAQPPATTSNKQLYEAGSGHSRPTCWRSRPTRAGRARDQGGEAGEHQGEPGAGPGPEPAARRPAKIQVRDSIRDVRDLPLSKETWSSAASQSRPDLLAIKLGVARSEDDINLGKANGYPDVYLLWQPYTYQNNSYLGVQSPTRGPWA